LPVSAFFEGSSAADASDRIVYDSATGALYFDSDGNGSDPAVRIATLSPGLTLSAGDFIII
jgi:Ca2+-binding RTX toxin-like protein